MIPKIILLPLVLLTVSSFAHADDFNAAMLILGGPCTYKEYRGYSHISAIKQKINNEDSYEVRFQFHPDRDITEPYAQVKGKELLLHTKRHTSPGKTYLQKNEIAVGKDFDTILHVIVKGTCTPTIFEFPSLTD